MNISKKTRLLEKIITNEGPIKTHCCFNLSGVGKMTCTKRVNFPKFLSNTNESLRVGQCKCFIFLI